MTTPPTTLEIFEALPRTPAPDPGELVSAPQIMARLGVSRSTVHRWNVRGLPSIGRRKFRRYRWVDVLAFVEGLGR